MIDIFGKQIFGSCADEWLKLCKGKKKEWILNHTKQNNEQLIDEFINNPKINKECHCLDCGKEKKDANISKSIPTETTTDVIDSNTSGNSGGGNKKGRASNKGT